MTNIVAYVVCYVAQNQCNSQRKNDRQQHLNTISLCLKHYLVVAKGGQVCLACPGINKLAGLDGKRCWICPVIALSMEAVLHTKFGSQTGIFFTLNT